jgi:hypothetical protein
VSGSREDSNEDEQQRHQTEAEAWDAFSAEHKIGIIHYDIARILERFNRTRHLVDKANILAWALHEPTLLYFEVRMEAVWLVAAIKRRLPLSRAGRYNHVFMHIVYWEVLKIGVYPPR